MTPAAQVLNDIACQLLVARGILHNASGNADMDAVAGACALIEQAGALADAAGGALGGGRVADDADWNLSPRAAEAMRAIGAQPK